MSEDDAAVDISERISPHRGRDPYFYLVLFLLVIPVGSIPPLSWAFVLHSLYTGSVWHFSWKVRTCFAVALAEVCFSIYHYSLARSIRGLRPIERVDVVALQSAFRHILRAGLANLPEDAFNEESLGVDRSGSPAESIEPLDYNDPRAIDFRNYLRTWFGKVPWSSIRRDEMSRWLYWAMFNSRMPSVDSMPKSHRHALEDGLENIAKRAGCKIPDGSNPSVTPILLTLDPVNVMIRPLLWYVGVSLVNFVARRYLRYRFNATFGVYNDFEYFIRIPHNWDPKNQETRPVIFIHGLGFGLFQYTPILTNLMSSLPEHAILVPIQAHISHDILHPQFMSPMGRYEVVKCLTGLLRELGWDTTDDKTKDIKQATVTIMSHSNGSFAHAWLLKGRPELMTRSCFVDPVTFCTWEGDVCYNFLYRPCRTALELLIYYFVSSEIGVANTLQRHFDWLSNSLRYEEVPNACDPSKSMYLFGGQDTILNSERVVRYLRSHGVKKGLIFTPDHRHGQALMPGSPTYGQIIDWIRGGTL